jgi:hypothetical protein
MCGGQGPAGRSAGRGFKNGVGARAGPWPGRRARGGPTRARGRGHVARQTDSVRGHGGCAGGRGAAQLGRRQRRRARGGSRGGPRARRAALRRAGAAAPRRWRRPAGGRARARPNCGQTPGNRRSNAGQAAGPAAGEGEGLSVQCAARRHKAPRRRPGRAMRGRARGAPRRRQGARRLLGPRATARCAGGPPRGGGATGRVWSSGAVWVGRGRRAARPLPAGTDS